MISHGIGFKILFRETMVARSNGHAFFNASKFYRAAIVIVLPCCVVLRFSW